MSELSSPAPETITIAQKRYEQLTEDQKLLDALHCAGGDNWEGYSEALQILEDGE